jgi:hypothetical protein
VWIIIGLGVIIVAILAAFTLPWRLGDDGDLGTISQQWLAEHRNQTR